MADIISTLWTQVLQPVVVTIAVGYTAVLAQKIAKYLGLKNEEKLRDALHSSAENAINFAASQLGSSVSDLVKSNMTTKVAATAIDYIKTNNKGTIKKLKVSDNALQDIVLSKIGKHI